MPITSGVPRSTDILRVSRHVSNVPICDIARERRGLVEGHADPLLLAPDNVTGNVRTVSLKDKVETLGNFVGVGDIERRPSFPLERLTDQERLEQFIAALDWFVEKVSVS